jgi:hypothetical protein
LLVQALPSSQLVPAFAGETTHCCVPVLQDVVPTWHGPAGQLFPAMQATQLPEPLHTMPAPHDVPAATSPVWSHADVPVLHEVMPVVQLVGLHVAPAKHWTHEPDPLHTWFGPQAVPGGNSPIALHTGWPSLHEVVPVEQLVGLHVAPATQDTHPPTLLQTSFVPQIVPAGRVPVTVQTGIPPAHEIVATSHRLGPVQVDPFAQVMHVPFEEQISPDPQLVPAGRSLVSMHCGEPLEQLICACLQGPLAAQLAPWLQATQLPLPSQTSPLPHEVPGGLFVESMHAGALPSHCSTPSVHVSLDTHEAPWEQTAQPEASQIWPDPQVPQASWPPQPSGGVPQVSPSAWHVVLVHPHWFGVPVPPHASGAVHAPVPHTTTPPHPSLIWPQSRLPQVFGVQAPVPQRLAPVAPQV